MDAITTMKRQESVDLPANILNVQDNRRKCGTENLNALSSEFWFNHSKTTENIAIFPLVKDVAKGTQTNKQAR